MEFTFVQEREISAAALAECQRTILALGKQLKILGFSESRQKASTDSPGSIKRMTESMELLRWRTESGELGPPQKTSSVASAYSSWDEVTTTTTTTTATTTAPPDYSTLLSLCHFRQSDTSAVHADGPVSVPASPARSDLEAPSTPESPAMVRRSVRTVRPLLLPKPPLSHEITPSNLNGDHPRTASAYTSFFARSLSETSVSSGHSNGNS